MKLVIYIFFLFLLIFSTLWYTAMTGAVHCDKNPYPPMEEAKEKCEHMKLDPELVYCTCKPVEACDGCESCAPYYLLNTIK